MKNLINSSFPWEETLFAEWLSKAIAFSKRYRNE
jgi:hypothetical protein